MSEISQTERVSDEELDQMILKLERDGMTPKMLSLMREVREVRRAKGEPVAWLLSGGGAKNDVRFDSSNAYADPLREVTPLYTAPQLPQPAVLSVSEGVLKSLLPDVEKSEFWFEHNGKIFFEGVRFNNAVFEACRAAMLSSRNSEQLEPVSNRDELKKGLAAIRNSGIAIDGEKILAERDVLNSPATPDGWIPVSERLPEDSQHIIIFCDGAFVLSAEYRDGEFFDVVRDGDEFFETTSRCVTHWQPLPAAPKEVG